MTSFGSLFAQRSLEAVFIDLLNMALSATWIMLAIILFRGILKRWLPRRAILWGWLPVVLRLLCPFSIESVFSLIPSGAPIPPDIPYANTPALDLGISFVEDPVNDLIAENLTPAPGASVNPLQIVTAVAALVWLVGVAALIIYMAVSYVLIRRRVRTAVRVPTAARLPRRATLWQCETVTSPFILGVISPRIYLPFGMDTDVAAHVLAHERAHLRRLDHVTKLLAFLVCAVYWFHPLVWLCYILYCRDAEAACDETVVKELDDEARRAYARSLLSFESGARLRPFCPPAFGETDVKTRVKGVLSYKKPVLWLLIAALALLVVLGVLFLTDPAREYENIPSDWYGISHITETVCDEQGFAMIPEDFVWTDGRITGLRMRLENDTAYDIGYGEPFRLEREEGGRWVDTAVTQQVFILPEYQLPAYGEVTKYYDISGYDLSVYARYRFVITINVHINEYGATESREALIYFTVSGSEALATPHPADFAISFTAQTGKVPNVLDTFEGYIQKDLVLAVPNKATCDYEPTEAELQYLWYLVEAYGITSMPADMHPEQTGDVHVAVTPNCEYTVTVRANGRTYTVRGDRTTGMVQGTYNKDFQAFVGHVYNFMVSTGQWRSLPEANGGYE